MNQTEPLTQPKMRGFGPVKAPGTLVILAFLALYAVDVSMRVTRKAFWFDELFTYYICRLPTLHDTWQAVLHGVDLNPPLFYILTRLSLNSIGGPVGARLPEMIGFGVLCLCLFRFVSVRAGTIAGAVAMTFPLVTGALFYAYEARPHGIVLGFCGLALVCWQMTSLQTTRERRGAALWNTCFGAALACAFLTHCYAILIGFPFVLAELAVSFRTRRIRWGTWAAMAIPGAIGTLITLRLLMVYKGLTGNTTFNQLFPANFSSLGGFYNELFGHFITVAIVLVPFLIYRFSSIQRNPTLGENAVQARTPNLPVEELALAAGFVVLPALGLLLAKVMHGPFIARYFLTSVIGFSILLSYALPSGGQWAETHSGLVWWRRALPSLILLVVMIGVAARDLRRTITPSEALGRESEALLEPSSEVPISMAAGDPLALDGLITSGLPPTIPIAVIDPVGFLPLTFYRPDLDARLFHVSWKLDDSVFPLEVNLRRWCHVDIHDPVSSQDFLQLHRDFVVYGRPKYLRELAKFVEAGAQVSQLHVDEHHFLAHVEVPAAGTR
jgi:hypothetical protein